MITSRVDPGKAFTVMRFVFLRPAPRLENMVLSWLVLAVFAMAIADLFERILVVAQRHDEAERPDAACEPDEPGGTISMAALERALAEHGGRVAMVLWPGVQYRSGQAFDLREVARLGHARGCIVGFDLAHAAGNLELALHDSNADFAAWCSYKYLNSGPGAVAGAFVHERHARADLPRFAGWWGNDGRRDGRHAGGRPAGRWPLFDSPTATLVRLGRVAAAHREEREAVALEGVQALELRDDVQPRPQPEVEGIAEADLGADVMQRGRRHRLDRAVGADRHERRRLDRAVRRDEDGGARGAGGGEDVEAEGRRERRRRAHGWASVAVAPPSGAQR